MIKKVKRVGHGLRPFANHRLRILLHAGGINWPPSDLRRCGSEPAPH